MPDNRRNHHGRDRIGQLEDRLQRAIRRLTSMCALMLAAILVGLYLVVNLIGNVNDERYHNIVTNCRTQNDRHDRTVRRLDAGLALARRTATPAQVARIRRSRDFTVGLIDSIAPRRPDCVAYADSQVKS